MTTANTFASVVLDTLRAVARLKSSGQRATLLALHERVPGELAELRTALRQLRGAGLIEVGPYEVHLTLNGLAVAVANMPKLQVRRARQLAA
jgi:hypothetical protein